MKAQAADKTGLGHPVQGVSGAAESAAKRPPGKRKSAAKRPAKAASALLTPSRARKLGLDHEDMTSADASLGRRYDLVGLLAGHPELEAAWRRGRLLRYIRRLGAKGATETEAAHELRIGLVEFQELLRTDIEAASHWNEARLDTVIWLKGQYLEKAAEGNARAMAQVENVLRAEIAHAQFNLQRVSEPLICEAFGVTRQCLNLWHRERGLPRNAGETTYDLPAVIAWYAGFLRAKHGAQAVIDTDPLRALKAERMQMDLAADRGELVARDEVVAALVARQQVTVRALERLCEELPPAAEGKTADQIRPIVEGHCRQARTKLCEVPDVLKLSDDKAAALAAVMEHVA